MATPSATRGALATQAVPSRKKAVVDAAPLEAAVGEVAAHAGAWAATGASARAVLLDRVLRDTLLAADGWLAEACRAKGLDPRSAAAGEELFAGIVTFVRMARLLRDALGDIAASGRPRYPGPVREAPGGRLAVGVFPVSVYDRVLFPQTTAEVWMEPGVSRSEVDAGQAAAYRDPDAARGVAVVLGAGNVASLGPRDVLSKLFVEGKVVVLKANPVNDYLAPHWTRAMRALLEAGVLRIVTGGAEVGAYLVNHPAVDEVHITGSDKTHDAVVFGPGKAGERRKASGRAVLEKPVTSELGNVSPVVIVPGRWSTADLLYQAEHVATMVVNNAGFNCLSARVLVTHSAWPQREAFLGALSEALTRVPTRLAYYPGASDRRAAFVDAHPDASALGRPGAGQLPWTLVRGVDPGHLDDICFNAEAFCGLTAETALAADSPQSFIDAATEFCNEVLWGTLSATVLAHPGSLRDAGLGAAVERSVAELRYGGIGLNVWHASVFALGTTTWGAYPGHPLADIQSGRGVVGNAFMFDRPEKSIVRGPFRSRPKPPWFATHPNGLAVMRRLLALEAQPSPVRLASVLAAALSP
ncbi:MAG: aldehyde dehydrogenase family protein [Acidimicrobiales bacterium]